MCLGGRRLRVVRGGLERHRHVLALPRAETAEPWSRVLSRIYTKYKLWLVTRDRARPQAV